MKRYIYDIEADGLLGTISKVHCIVIRDFDSKEVFTFHGDKLYQGMVKLDEADELIGHNIIDYDIPALKKIFNWQPKDETSIVDTLVLCRLAHPAVRDEDFGGTWSKKLEVKSYGSQSLLAWGQRLGEYKGNFEGPWEEFSDEMLEYCIQDTVVNDKIYQHLLTCTLDERAVKLEHDIAKLAVRMEHCGFPFDTSKAQDLYAELLDQREKIRVELTKLFPVRTIERISEKTGKPLKPQIIEFNPGSRDHIAYWFKEKYKWKPKDFTSGGKPEINEEILESLEYPEAAKLKDYFMLDKRIGMIAEGNGAWLKLVGADGRLHGRVNTNGAHTGRMTHSSPNMAQVPSVRKPYGIQCRELFTVPPGYKQVGTDLSGIELRVLAHYMAKWDDGEYGSVILDGDIHWTNTQAFGFVPDGTIRDSHNIEHEKARSNAKIGIYALLYGGGAAKMGSIVSGGKKEGEAIRQQFFKKLPAFEKLSNAVRKAADRGYLVGLDGRHMTARSAHAAMNTLLQGGAAQVFKQWAVLYEQACEAEGWVNGKDFWLMAMVHDEIQACCREDLAERMAEIAVQTANRAGEILLPHCRVDAESKIGNNWSECH